MINWMYVIIFIAGAYIGSNIPRAYKVYKEGVVSLASYYRVEHEKQKAKEEGIYRPC